jgi:predicted DNA-binding protein with PD1-like motif
MADDDDKPGEGWQEQQTKHAESLNGFFSTSDSTELTKKRAASGTSCGRPVSTARQFVDITELPPDGCDAGNKKLNMSCKFKCGYVMTSVQFQATRWTKHILSCPFASEEAKEAVSKPSNSSTANPEKPFKKTKDSYSIDMNDQLHYNPSASTSTSSRNVASGSLKVHAIRLSPGEDLVPALKRAANQAMQASNSTAAFVMTAVGSVSEVTLRMAHAFAGSHPIRVFPTRLEIVSLVGTFSYNSGMHLHMSLSDAEGSVIGGHLIAGKIFTTLELVLGTIETVDFSRQMDARTGYRELVVEKQQEKEPGEAPFI